MWVLLQHLGWVSAKNFHISTWVHLGPYNAFCVQGPEPNSQCRWDRLDRCWKHISSCEGITNLKFVLKLAGSPNWETLTLFIGFLLYATSAFTMTLIKTITKFLNMIGYHKPELSTNRILYWSCSELDSVIGQLKGQLTPHVNLSGQNALYACTVVSHFTELTVFFFMKTYDRCLVSFTNVVIVLIHW